MPADATFLSQIQLFQRLDDDERGVLAQQMAERTLATGEGSIHV